MNAKMSKVQRKLKLSDKKYSFKGELWKHSGPGGWCFITVPLLVSKMIRELHSVSEEGWGRLKTTASIGSTSWETAIWFDTKKDAYLLPVKSIIRGKEKLAIGSVVAVKLLIRFDTYLSSKN